MKKVGKIGELNTILDPQSAFGQLNYLYAKNKIESKGGFTSIRTNNCLVSGKWCYEVQVLTNGLMQIGWSQLNTVFNNHEGVGDDESSYAYDGYRVCKWHRGKENYGMIWDIGDILGCCIDLNLGTAEYFLNGTSLGIAFENIPIGENKAYFAGISLSDGESCAFNFGKSPFHYSYPGYETIDLPDSQTDGNLEITAGLLEVIKSHILKILSHNIDFYHKMMISQKIFGFLIEVAFDDVFIMRKLLFPFLLELIENNPVGFLVFFDHIYLFSKEKNNFFVSFFENFQINYR